MAEYSAAERWLPIVGYLGLYEVSDWGRVRSIDRLIETVRGLRRVSGRIMRLHPQKSGHLNVTLCNGASRHLQFRVHTLVLEAFVGERPPGMEGCHGSKGHADNSPSNLRWDTHTENVRDTVRHGYHHEAIKAACPYRHKLVDPNLRADSKRINRRGCKACEIARGRARAAKRVGRPYDLAILRAEAYARIMQEVQK